MHTHPGTTGLQGGEHVRIPTPDSDSHASVNIELDMQECETFIAMMRASAEGARASLARLGQSPQNDIPM